MTLGAFFARTNGNNPDQSTWQKLEDHLTETGSLAAGFCKGMPWCTWACTAGLWHDLGKYLDAFQKRLEDGHTRVVHSTAGAVAAKQVYENDAYGGYHIARILGYVIAGHHAGLADGESKDPSSLVQRLKRDPTLPTAVPRDILRDPGLSINDIRCFSEKGSTKPSQAFGISLFIRMLFSCVVDSDRLNSEAFADPQRCSLRDTHPSLPDLDLRFSEKLATFTKNAPDTPVNKHRAAILNSCLDAAKMHPGLFSLTVPTGGGKTLSSLAFALKHALHHNDDQNANPDFQRIIYVIPYTSIIEQNAKTFREYLGDDAVIEHHSSYDPPERGEETTPHQLATENWDAPMIVTTAVQFFESLFSHTPSRCRKLHNIMNSVVILDEAQMMPPHLLRPCMEAIRELTDHYNTTVVLCTATQPALSIEDGMKNGFNNVREIIPDRNALFSALKRVETRFIGQIEESELADRLGCHEQVLCIVNTKKHARTLYELVNDSDNTFHLSTLMYPGHRRRTLDEIRQRLKDGLPCRVISTQLIEAGVDVDFPVVYREMTGVDSIAQAAGRCNREGELKDKGRVHVFELPDGVPQMFRQQAQTTQVVMRRHGGNLLSPDAITSYFNELYWAKGDEQLDHLCILKKLEDGLDTLSFPFREIGEKFRLIDERTHPVLIPADESAKDLIEAFRYGAASRSMFREAQKYTVSLYATDYNNLMAAQAIETIHEYITILMNDSLYDKHVGLKTDDPHYRAPDSLIT